MKYSLKFKYENDIHDKVFENRTELEKFLNVSTATIFNIKNKKTPPNKLYGNNNILVMDIVSLYSHCDKPKVTRKSDDGFLYSQKIYYENNKERLRESKKNYQRDLRAKAEKYDKLLQLIS